MFADAGLANFFFFLFLFRRDIDNLHAVNVSISWDGEGEGGGRFYYRTRAKGAYRAPASRSGRHNFDGII